MDFFSEYSDEELVFLCQQKNEFALALLTEKYMNVAKYIASGYFLENADQSDLVQEGMIGFLSAVYSYKKDSAASFNTYCSKCIKNRIISLIRTEQSKKDDSYQIVNIENERNTPSSELTPEEKYLSDKSAAEINKIITQALTDTERNVFYLHLKGLSYRHIAELTGLTAKAVDSTLQRCRKKLRNKLQNEV